MTPRGHDALRKQLEDLKSQRPELAKAIEIARSHGDLSENADYDAAKNKSGLVEAKIRDLESRLSDYEIIDPAKISNPSSVVFGTTIDLLDLDSDQERTVSIYGDEESDPAKGWISYNTPFALGLFGKEVGDVAILNLPAGKKEYEIIAIRIDYTT